MIALRVAAAAMLSAAGLFPADPDDAEFQKLLQQVLRASAKEFEPVEGARIENRRRDFYFQAKTFLPGADECQILLTKEGPVYECFYPTEKDAATVFDRLAARIGNALGTEWARREGRRRNAREVVFAGESKPVVQVIQEKGARVVHLYVTPAARAPGGVTGDLPRRPEFLLPNPPP